MAAVDEANGPEDDVILAGDFNFAADDYGWELSGYRPLVAPSTPTTITESSSYDNFWIDPEHTREFEGLIEVYAFDEILFDNDDKAASLAVSDHRPVAALFRNDLGDDDPAGNWAGAAALGADPATEDREPAEIRIHRVVAHPTDDEAVTLLRCHRHRQVADRHRDVALEPLQRDLLVRVRTVPRCV